MAVSTNKVVKWERGSAELTQTSFIHQFGSWVYLKGHLDSVGEFQKHVITSNTNTQTRAYFNNKKRDRKKKQANEDNKNSPTTRDS